MARLIDADALLEEHCDGCSLAQREECKADPVCASAMWIVEAPTVDAVEVVRCKDCKHYDNTEGIQWCHLNSKLAQHGLDWHSFPEDGFCSYGERRTDER